MSSEGLKKASGLEEDDGEEGRAGGSSVAGSDSGDEFGLDEDYHESMARRLYELEGEKERLVSANVDLQRRAALLVAREKMMQGQNSTAKTAAEAAQQAFADAELMVDQMLEKEKQFREVLQLVVEGRTKLTRQQGEFDQLALDLQTRLDDKEFKATEIAKSFKKFKR